MANATIAAVEQGWAGDRKRHLVVAQFTASDLTFSRRAAGLQHIEAIIPTNRIGTFKVNGVTVTTTNAGTFAFAAGTVDTVTVTPQTNTTMALYVYGW